MDVFSTSTQGMSTQAYALQNISGNVANATTVGYKRTDTGFADLIPDASTGDYVAGSVGAHAETTSDVAGTLSSTGISTNMALSGAGYFVVAQNSGTSATPGFSGANLYTRRGDFAADANGYLVNGAGYYLLGNSGGSSPTSPIKISNTKLASGATLSSVDIGSDGTVTGSYSDGQSAKLGQVAVAQLPAGTFLRQQDGGAFSATTNTGTPVYGLGGSTIAGGEVEGSNTDISDQFSKMIMTQQAYQSNSKVLSTANEMMQDAINILR